MGSQLSLKSSVCILFKNFKRSFSYYARRGMNAPIFIVACGHSGTSLLLAMLGSHSKLHAIPNESGLAYDWANQKPVMRKTAWKSLLSFDAETIQAKKVRWVEKTPSHIKSIPELLTLCSNAKIILMVRDGRDVATSLFERTGDLEGGITRWVSDNEAGKKFWSHKQVMMVKYENLVSDPRQCLNEIFDFVEEQFEEQVLNYQETPRKYYSSVIEKPSSAFGENHEQYRNWQINQPLFDGRGKWQKLSQEQREVILKIGGDMLSDLGYTEPSVAPRELMATATS